MFTDLYSLCSTEMQVNTNIYPHFQLLLLNNAIIKHSNMEILSTFLNFCLCTVSFWNTVLISCQNVKCFRVFFFTIILKYRVTNLSSTESQAALPPWEQDAQHSKATWTVPFEPRQHTDPCCQWVQGKWWSRDGDSNVRNRILLIPF